jgi:release factor glutamine methyltransferase
MDSSALIAYGENVVDRARLKRLSSFVQRRKSGEPVAYIVGSKEFCGLRLAVDKRVLVPRPETEELVELVVRDWHGCSVDVLDLGTGCGAIACALAVMLPKSQIIATDISADALEVAGANVSGLALVDQVELHQGDLFDAFDQRRRFDVIVANLPYVGTDDDDFVEKAVRDYEPSLALFGGKDGLDVYRRMLPHAAAYLKPNGALYMESGPHNARTLAGLATEVFRTASIDIVSDLAGLERIVVIRTGARAA